ncbi:MAG: hypothetical protein JNK53_02200, partial [Phycisphaerae bacterium]|nr:hypothetical protein [Phycisphaerae bacterium]
MIKTRLCSVARGLCATAAALAAAVLLSGCDDGTTAANSQPVTAAVESAEQRASKQPLVVEPAKISL